MTSCSVLIPELKAHFTESKKRAQALMKDMKVTKEGEVLEETIAVAEQALELLQNNPEDMPLVDRTSLIGTVPGVVARKHLKDVFKGGISQRANSKTPRQDLVLKNAIYENGDVVLTVTPKGKNYEWKYVFEPNANVSKSSTNKGTSLFIPHFREVFSDIQDSVWEAEGVLTHRERAKVANTYLAGMYDSLGKAKNTNDLLGSSADGSPVFNYKRASERPHYLHGSKKHMKNLLADLHAITDNSVDSDTFEYYDDLLDNMHEHFFREMNVYIDENADHTYGWVDLDKGHILLNVSSKWHEGMSNEEVYMHELIHTMTVWGLRQEGFDGSRMRARMNRIRKVARQNIKWQHIAKANPAITEEQAKIRHDYIFKDDTSDEEFLAYALTNPAFGALLKTIKLKDNRKTGFFGSIVDFFVDLMNAVMGNYDFSNRKGNLKDEIHSLAFKIAEINTKADKEVKEGGFFYMLGDLVDRLEGNFEEFVAKATSSLDSETKVEIPENMTKMQKVMFMAGFFTKGIYNQNYRNAVGTYFSLLGIKPDSTIREVFRNFLPKLNDAYYEAEREGLKTTSIDNLRNLHSTAAAKSILDGFTKTLTENEEIALTTTYLESNVSTLFYKNKNYGKGYTTKQIATLLSDTGMRKRTMGRIEAHIKKVAGKRTNWVIGQANGLGKLMATGKGHEAQMTNSISIARGYGTSERFKQDPVLVALIEELASLRALDYQDKAELRVAAQLLLKEEKGVRNIVNLYNNFKQMSAEQLFADDPSHIMEGYTKELFDDTIEVRYEKLSDEAALKKEGFTLVSKVENNGLVGGVPLGIYVSKTYTQAERLRGSVGLGSPQSRGLSQRDIRFKQFGENKKHAQVYFENDKIKLNEKAIRINKELEKGTSFDAIPEGAVPIVDATGNTVDYRNMMEKKTKAKFLKQDRTVSKVLSRTSSSVIDKVARAQQNEEVLKLIKKNLKEFYDNPSSSNNLEEYKLISADSPEPELRRLFNMLPKTYRDFANSRKDRSLPIPAVLMHQYFGYTHYRFTDVPGINRLPETIKHILNMLEAYWMDLVKIAKGNILLKMPIVLVTNIISNIIFAINTGSNPIELVAQYRDSIRDVKDFMRAHKEQQQLQIELASMKQDYMNINFTPEALAEHKEKTKDLEDRIARLAKEMAKNEVKELFDLGMYQSVIEDVEMYKLGDTNKVSDGMDKLLNKLPTMVRTPLQIAYLSKETAWYKINQEVLQLSDLVARDVMNRKQKMLEQQQADGKRDLPVEYREMLGFKGSKRRELKGAERERFLEIAKRSRHANLLNYFVNYQLPNGRGEEYLNRIGLLMFTKYLKRIQHVVTTTGVKHPIRTATTLAAASFMIDVDTIQDQALLVKAFDEVDSGVLGIVPLYSPVDVLLNVLTPALVKLVPSV